MGQGRRSANGLLGRGLLALAAAVSMAVVGVGGVSSAVAAPGETHGSERLAGVHGERLAQSARAGSSAAEKTGVRQELNLRGDGSDANAYLMVDPDCVRKTGGKAKPNASVGTTSKLTLDYVLTGPDDERTTGTVKVKAGKESSLGLPAVTVGSYKLTVARHGSSTLVGDETFVVRPCVQVKSSCHAVTFTNPTGNPDAYVVYGGHKQRQLFDLSVPAGTSLTVRADYSRIDFVTYGVDESEDQLPVSLGNGKVSVRQHCATLPAAPGSNAVQSSGELGCSQVGAPAAVTLEWAVQPSVKKTRYELVDDATQTVVKAASFSGGKHTFLSLPAGTYHYRSFAKGVAEPFEDVTFSVLRCVQVTPVCRALQVENPNAVALDVFVVDFDDDDPAEEPPSVDTTAAPDGTTTVAWDHPGAYVFVSDPRETPGTRFLSDSLTPDLGYGDVEVEVPQDC